MAYDHAWMVKLGWACGRAPAIIQQSSMKCLLLLAMELAPQEVSLALSGRLQGRHVHSKAWEVLTAGNTFVAMFLR